MKTMDSYPSTQKPKLKSYLRSKLELSSPEANGLVNEYRAIKDACYKLATEVFSKELSGSLFETEIFSQYPRLEKGLKADWVNESMMAQFR